MSFRVDDESGGILREITSWFVRVGRHITLQHLQPQGQSGDASDREIYECQLTGSLTAGGNTTAKLLKWDGTSAYAVTGDEFQVYDDLYGTLTGEDGSKGTFIWRHKRRVLLTLVCE